MNRHINVCSYCITCQFLANALHAHCAGDIKLVISAKVDVRDGVAWSSLDKYIKNIEGGGPGASGLQPHHSDDAAAAVAAAGVADTEEEAESGRPQMRLNF